jgi:hypothetical protein
LRQSEVYGEIPIVRALGRELSPTLLALADEVIE